MKVSIYQSSDGWRWRARAANNEIIATGEAYVDRRDAQHAIDLIFKHHPEGIEISDETTE